MEKSENITIVSDMVTNFIMNTVENEVKKTQNVNLESVVEFIKNSDISTFNQIIEMLECTDAFDEYVDAKVKTILDESDDYFRAEDIDISVVENLGLSEDVATNFFDTMSDYGKRDWIKSQIDNL